MRNKNVLFQLIYRAVWFIVALISTITTITDHLPVSKGGDGKPTAIYFTTWSVWLVTLVAVIVFVFTLISFIKGEKEKVNNPVPLLKFSSNIMIIATFIVGGFVLGQFFTSFGAIFKHFLLPLITIGDSLLFDPKNSYRVSYPFLGVVLPLIYWFIIIVRIVIKRGDGVILPSQWDNYYPYGFTNLDNGKTLGGLIGLLGGILVGLIIVGFIFWVIDKLSKKEGKISFDASINEETTKDFIHLIKEKMVK